MTDLVLSVRLNADGSGLVGQLKLSKDQVDQLKVAQTGAAGAAKQLETATTALGNAQARTATQARAAAQAVQVGTSSLRQQQAGMQQLGMQFGDFTQQLALGTPFFLAFGQQANQAAGALALMGGRAGAVGAVLAGPFGAAATAAVTIVGMLTMSLLQNEEASKLAEAGADGLSDAQSALGGIFDLVSGKIEKQNQLLVLNARLMAINLRAEAQSQRASARDTFANAGDVNALGQVAGIFNRYTGDVMGARGGAQDRLYRDVLEKRISIEEGLKRSEGMNFDGLEVSRKEFQQALIDTVSAAYKEETARLIDQSLDQGRLAEALRRDPPKGRQRKPRDGTAAAERLEEFGEDAASRIAGITGRFAGQPKLIEQAAAAMRQLDDIVDDINRKKPPNLQQLLDDAGKARTAIQEGVNRPYQDYVEQQLQAIDNIRLLKSGREAEAAAMQVIVALEEKMGALTPARKEAVLATVEALRAEERQLDIIRQKQETYLRALGDVRAIITDTIADGVRGLEDLPGQLLASFKRLTAEVLVESLFGDTFRKIEDQITGASVATDAADRMAEAVDKAAASIAKLGDAAESAATGVASTAQQDAAGSTDGEIVVTGSRVPRDPAGFFGYVVEKLAGGILGERASKAIGKVVGDGLQGALVGQIAGGVAGSVFGGRQSDTGAAIGGAIGNIAGKALAPAMTAVFGQALGSAAGPIGSIVGGILGSAVGGLIKGAQRGSATITGIDSGISSRGNNSQFKSAASGLAKNVQGALGQIAEQLGGGVGDFNLSVGVRDGNLRLDPTGRGVTKTKKGAIDFGKDEAALISAAIADAIRDGGVTGLSAAVQQALRSSSDIDKALREALKVDEVETLLQGLGGTLQKEFRDFERQAAERVRIARQYGFDLVKLEELNAKERSKMFEDILGSRIGSLRDLLEDLDFGDLFEGSLVEQRDKLLVEISKVRADAAAGVDGAADKLADLNRRLIDLSRDAFGTAGGEFAADRSAARSAAEEIIRIENERVKAAQDAAIGTNQKLDTANNLANETNDLLAETNAILRSLAAIGVGGGNGAVARFALNTARQVQF
jgi:hypothetical protein